MCNFFSCIVTKNGDVLFDPMSDSHEAIIEANRERYDLTDNTCDPAELRFARVEITPPDNDVFRPVSEWSLKIDQSITPVWWSEFYAKNAFAILENFLTPALLVGKNIQELTEGRFWVKDCKIATVKGGVFIVVLFGSSQVGAMYGSSQVGEMSGSSQVRAMFGSSQVRAMYDSSQVGVMFGSSQVGEMSGSSQVRAMYDSSQVGAMYDSSQVRAMYGSSQVGVMEQNSIAIIKTGINPKILVANNKIELIAKQ
jgi:hypothetical protein